MGIISITFMIVGAYFIVIGLDSAGLYLATASSLRKIIQISPLKDYDILKSLGQAKVQNAVLSRVQHISKQVIDELESNNLVRTSLEPVDIRQYIQEVIREKTTIDLSLSQKQKDRVSD